MGRLQSFLCHGPRQFALRGGQLVFGDPPPAIAGGGLEVKRDGANLAWLRGSWPGNALLAVLGRVAVLEWLS
jgi:hypothetical protein